MGFESKILGKGIQDCLYNSEKTLSTAESCTGGRIAAAIVSVPGASNYYKGSVVAYTNEVKEHMLGVNHATIEEHTEVSEEVVREMVLGAIKALGTDYAIATTGVAGPTGGTSATPVGTIWVGYGSSDDVRTVKLTEDNGRDLNLESATSTAMRLMLEFLQERVGDAQDE